MMKIAFLGFGVYGKAIASLLDINGVSYVYTKKSDQETLGAVVDVLFIAVPAQAVRVALESNKHCITKDTIIINLAKGIEQCSHKLMHEVVGEVCDVDNYFSLSGPSFADELSQRMPTSVSIGYKNDAYIDIVRGMLETSFFRLEETSSLRAVELAGAMKNVYAIVSGYSTGLGFNSNTRTYIILSALKELDLLARSMFSEKFNILQPATVGDMILTCNSTQSRNFKYGVGMAAGDYDVDGRTIEGYYTSQSVSYLTDNYGVNLPIARLAARIISKDIKDKETFVRELMYT